MKNNLEILIYDPNFSSKGHYVRGIRAREVMGRTKKRGIQKFKNLLISGLQNYMDRTATKFGV